MPLYLIATKWRLITGLRQSMKTLRMRTVAVTFVKKTTRWNSIRKRSFSCNSRTQQFGSWRGNEMDWNEVWSVKCEIWSVKCEVWSVIIQVHIYTKFWGSKRNSSWNKWYNCHACALGSSLLTFSHSASKKSGGLSTHQARYRETAWLSTLLQIGFEKVHSKPMHYPQCSHTQNALPEWCISSDSGTKCWGDSFYRGKDASHWLCHNHPAPDQQ